MFQICVFFSLIYLPDSFSYRTAADTLLSSRNQQRSAYLVQNFAWRWERWDLPSSKRSACNESFHSEVMMMPDEPDPSWSSRAVVISFGSASRRLSASTTPSCMTLICAERNCYAINVTHAILNKPSNRLNPVLELVVALGRDLKSGARRQYRVGELFIVGDRQMIELRVNTLNIPE